MPDRPLMEFHVSRDARDRYQFDDALFSFNGNVILANFHAARVFAQKMNQKRDLVRFPEQAVRAGQISAMGLIDEINHAIFRRYREQTNPAMLRDALAYLNATLGAETVERMLWAFGEQFPPVAVYRRQQTLDEYLAGETGGMSHREVALEELLMLWLANVNPAFAPFRELFDDSELERGPRYTAAIDRLYEFFSAQPAPFGGAGGAQNIIDLLRAPALAAPHSLEAQLDFFLNRWGQVIDRQFLYRLLTATDVIREEEKPVFGVGGGDTAAASLPLADFRGLEAEPEQFTPDRDWMPRCVLIAKNAFVWLDQLTRRYGRPITTLDQIPDEELDALAQAGITGLWLIGLWERSEASKRIKQIMGNPDAVASAYSLYDYVIARDLGGEAAVQELRERAWRRGIRLASDMVPNHVGIDGRWVLEHPERFIQLPYPPFPSYTFNGPDLSSDERVGIFIEDHYYDRSDAAVVFKRLDRWTGSTTYIYHGNDGTSMPWNDTAQLNYLLPETREAVIQTILHVARQFPIIRFDAAMTLAKRHYQRLWFPEPGSGGDIPSRAEHGMTRAQFDAAMPEEFWREVVDRCAAEAPDTLLLAEAFWLMEGYFVRTLGMHRVYNSAFMVLLRDEDNAKYRQLMKNTLEFDPEILKRYVNFMNNPDEKTAVEQFGKGDKYFGVCTLMVTMPGLPMFGHGQIEGFTEKYGMEYRRAYYDEQPDEWLVARHRREIFPLVHKRYLFAEVRDFLLYDFYQVDGTVNEDVFAYSNRHGDERGLVVYLNRFESARGWVRLSAAYAVKGGDGAVLAQKTLGEGLGLRAGEHDYTIFRDHAAGLEYIRRSRELHDQGLYIELGAYKCHVFLDFREVTDGADRRYGRLAEYLGGRGVPSIEEALREIFLAPLREPFRALVNAGRFRALAGLADRRGQRSDARRQAPGARDAEDGESGSQATEAGSQAAGDREQQMAAEDSLPAQGRLSASEPRTLNPAPRPLLDDVEAELVAFLEQVRPFAGGAGEPAMVAAEIRARLEALLRHGVAPAEAAAAQGDGATAGEPASDEGAAAGEPAGDEEATEASEAAQPAAPDAPADQSHAAHPESFILHRSGDWAVALGWLFVHYLGALVEPDDPAPLSRSWIDEWLLGRVLDETLREMGMDEGAAARGVALIKILTAHQRWFAGEPQPAAVLKALLEDDDVRRFLGVNRYQDVLWYRKESFEELCRWLGLVAAVAAEADGHGGPAEALLASLAAADAASEYQVEKLLSAAQERG